MTANQTYICAPSQFKILREIVNNDLLLRHTVTILTDSYVPRDMVYIVSTDKMIEFYELTTRSNI